MRFGHKASSFPKGAAEMLKRSHCYSLQNFGSTSLLTKKNEACSSVQSFTACALSLMTVYEHQASTCATWNPIDIYSIVQRAESVVQVLCVEKCGKSAIAIYFPYKFHHKTRFVRHIDSTNRNENYNAKV